MLGALYRSAPARAPMAAIPKRHLRSTPWTPDAHCDVRPICHRHLVRLPRRYLLVWTGAELPYAARLAIERIVHIDPTAEIELHLGTGDGGPHVDAVRAHHHDQLSVHAIRRGHELDGIDAVTARRCRLALDAIPAGAASAWSNLVRYAILHRRGGVYVDTDVLLLRPITELANGRAFVGIERVWRHDRARVEHGWGWRMLPGTLAFGTAYGLRRADLAMLRGRARSAERLRLVDPLWTRLQLNNAVIGAPAGSELTGRLLERAATVDPRHRYALGPSLLSDLLLDEPTLAHIAPETVLYPVPPSESHRFFEDRTLVLPDATAVVHYVASNHRDVMRTLADRDRRTAARPEIFWSLCRQIEAARNDHAPNRTAA